MPGGGDCTPSSAAERTSQQGFVDGDVVAELLESFVRDEDA